MKNCVQCEHYELVSDGYGLCMRDTIGVMVIDDYEHTKNYLHCLNDKQSDEKYGQMAYQKEEK